MNTSRHLDGYGNTVSGPAVYVVIRDSFSLGGGAIAVPGRTMLIEKARAVAWIHNGYVREATPEEIALFEAERARDQAALADARAGDDAAAQAAAAAALEEEVEKRVAARLEQVQNEITVKFSDEEVRRLVAAAFSEAGLDPDEADDGNAPGKLGEITNGDPAGQNRDPRPSGPRRGRS